MKRLAILNEDGTLEIGGVKCKVVPVEPIHRPFISVAEGVVVKRYLTGQVLN